MYKKVGDMKEKLSERYPHYLFLTDLEKFKYEDWQEMSLSSLKADKDDIDVAREVKKNGS